MTAAKYVNRIVRKIKCSGKERKEIKSQLLSDISAATEQGESLEDVQKRMGTAAEVAEEFNANISEAEHRKYRRNHRIKISVAITGVVLAVLAMIAAYIWWWLPKSYEFGHSGKYEEAVVVERAQEVIAMFNAGDYDGINAISIEAMKEARVIETLEDAKKLISDDWGEFKGFNNYYMVEMEQQGYKGVMVQIAATYENVVVTYVISLDEEMRLMGIYMR